MLVEAIPYLLPSWSLNKSPQRRQSQRWRRFSRADISWQQAVDQQRLIEQTRIPTYPKILNQYESIIFNNHRIMLSLETRSWPHTNVQATVGPLDMESQTRRVSRLDFQISWRHSSAMSLWCLPLHHFSTDRTTRHCQSETKLVQITPITMVYDTW
jgi:hypothetical protein